MATPAVASFPVLFAVALPRSARYTQQNPLLDADWMLEGLALETAARPPR